MVPETSDIDTAMPDQLEIESLAAMCRTPAKNWPRFLDARQYWFSAPFRGLIFTTARTVVSEGIDPSPALVRQRMIRDGTCGREVEAAFIAIASAPDSSGPRSVALRQELAAAAYVRIYRTELAALAEDIANVPLADAHRRLVDVGTRLAHLARCANIATAKAALKSVSA